MNNQEAFNISVPALLKQNCKSISRGMCKYRGNDGTRCAIGHLIPDSIYDKEMEGKRIPTLYSFPAIKELFKDCDHVFLYELQDVHDENEPQIWQNEFNILAKKHNLTMPEIKEGI